MLQSSETPIQGIPGTGPAAVGLMFNGALAGLLDSRPDCTDFLSIIPERFWQDFGRAHTPRFRPLPDETALLDRLAEQHRLVAHGVGLSIASGSTFDIDHVRQLAEWHRRYDFAWISEHLSAVRVRTEETPDHHAGLALPLAWDHDLLDLVSVRFTRSLTNMSPRTTAPLAKRASTPRSSCENPTSRWSRCTSRAATACSASTSTAIPAPARRPCGNCWRTPRHAVPTSPASPSSTTSPTTRRWATTACSTSSPACGRPSPRRCTMSIAEFQRAFADLVAHPEQVLGVRAGDDAVLADYDLSPRERERLEILANDEGMSVNCSLYRVNRLIPVYSVLPHTCRLLGDRLMAELDGFWAASRHATLQYRWESWRFGLVRLRHDPQALLDPAVPASALQPAPGEIGVLVDATTRPVRVHVVAD